MILMQQTMIKALLLQKLTNMVHQHVHMQVVMIFQQVQAVYLTMVHQQHGTMAGGTVVNGGVRDADLLR